MTGSITPIRPGMDAPKQVDKKDHSICEGCFVVSYGNWQPDPANPADKSKYLKSCPKPLLTPTENILQCCICGGPTIVGIFFKQDASNLPCRGVHPSAEEAFGPGNPRNLKR